MSKSASLGALGYVGVAFGAVAGFLAGVALAVIVFPNSMETPIRGWIVIAAIVVGMIVGGRFGKAISAAVDRRSTLPAPKPD